MSVNGITKTSRREIYEEKITIPFKCYTIKEIFNGLTNYTFARTEQTPYNQVINPKTTNYDPSFNTLSDTTQDDNQSILDFQKTVEFQTTYPYKYVNKIDLVIDSITIQTTNFYDPTETNDERFNSIVFKNIQDFLPIQFKINNKEISFSEPTFYDGDYYEDGIIIGSDPLQEESEIVRLGTYSQKFDKIFELSAYPTSFDLSLNLNSSMGCEYLKNPITRAQFALGTGGDAVKTLQEFLYNSLNIVIIRIDARIISHIDYSQTDTQFTTIIREPEQLTTKPLSKKEEDKLKKKLKNIKLYDIFPDLPTKFKDLYISEIEDDQEQIIKQDIELEKKAEDIN